MANLSENPQWVDGIYQIETSDPVVGGPDGVSNRQAKELASRTSYLKKEQEKTGSDLAKHTAAADPHTQYAPKENPSFTGTPKAPTPATDSNSQQIATTAFVRSVGSTKLAKDQHGADIPDKAAFYNNLQLRGSLGNGMTFARCDQAGDYVTTITDPNTVSDMPEFKGKKLYGYGVLHVSRRDNFVGQEYINHSGDYAWRQKWDDAVFTPWVVALSSSRVPTAADVGALPENATAQAAAKLATPRTINGVPFDGTANITLTPANLGLTETVDLAAGALAKSMNGSDIPDKTTFYNNVSLRGTLGNGMTFANCDKAGDYVVMITDPSTVPDMPTYKGQKLYGYGVLHVSRRDNFVGQEYINHSGDYAWRQKWDDGVYAPWVIALSSSRVPTATDVGAYTKAETDTHVTGAIATANSANANANSRVPSVRKVNGKALTADITLTADDVGAMPANSSGTRIWVSGEYTPVINTPIVVSHGLVNINPLHCRCDVLVKCIVAEGEYRVGDFAINPMTLFIQNSVGHPYSLLPALNTSTIQLNMMNNLVASFKSSTVGNQKLNTDYWRFIFRIFY